LATLHEGDAHVSFHTWRRRMHARDTKTYLAGDSERRTVSVIEMEKK
jgi:hypothetical protein